MPNNNAIFWRNLCKIFRLCQDIVLSIVSRLIYHLRKQCVNKLLDGGCIAIEW